MKSFKLISLSSLIILGLLAGCSSQQELAFPDQSQMIQANADQIDTQYIVSAYALVDKMAKTTSIVDQEKIKKDFEKLIYPANRATLNKLIQYTTKVLQENLKPNQDFRECSVSILIYSTLGRINELYRNFGDRLMDTVLIVEETNPQKQEELILKFEKNISKLAKMDTKNLIAFIKNEDGSSNNVIDPNSQIAKRIITILEAHLNK